MFTIDRVLGLLLLLLSLDRLNQIDSICELKYHIHIRKNVSISNIGFDCSHRLLKVIQNRTVCTNVPEQGSRRAYNTLHQCISIQDSNAWESNIGIHLPHVHALADDCETIIKCMLFTRRKQSVRMHLLPVAAPTHWQFVKHSHIKIHVLC